MTLVEIDAARLWFEEAGTGPAVVLVHGGLGDSRMWDGQFEPFAGRFRDLLGVKNSF
jgi:pimeloyl-ACP methyl ester carboxylesterase